MDEFKESVDVIEKQAFVAIRHKISDFEDHSNNDEIAGFVKGVCEYEKILYSLLLKKLGDIE